MLSTSRSILRECKIRRMQFDVEEVSSYLHVHTYTRTLRSTLNFSIRISRMLVFKINNYGFIPISSGSIMNTTVSFNTVLSDNNENSKCFIFVRGALKARMEILTHRFVPGCFLQVILPCGKILTTAAHHENLSRKKNGYDLCTN